MDALARVDVVVIVFACGPQSKPRSGLVHDNERERERPDGFVRPVLATHLGEHGNDAFEQALAFLDHGPINE